MFRCFIETHKKAVSGIMWFLKLVEWVLFQKNCTALWNRSRTQLFPLISICQLVTFVCFICGIIWTPPHMLCHVWWFIKRGLCPQHQLGSKKSSNHGGHGQKAPAHLVDRPTELICITNINTRDDLLSPKYQAVSSVFLNVISHRGPAMSIHLTCCFL